MAAATPQLRALEQKLRADRANPGAAHNYDKYGTNLVGSTAVPVTAFQDVWTQIATHYATETAVLGYDLMNEPVGTGNTWWSTAQSAVNAIRLVDTTHYIIVEGDSWGLGGKLARSQSEPRYGGSLRADHVPSALLHRQRRLRAVHGQL